MQAIDTNILARWLLRDEPEQAELAEGILSKPCYIPTTVLLETGWLLHKKAGLSRAQTATMLDTIIAMETAMIDRADGISWAIDRFRGGADWADVLHLVQSAGLSLQFLTFDQKIKRQAGPDAPVAVVTVSPRG